MHFFLYAKKLGMLVLQQIHHKLKSKLSMILLDFYFDKPKLKNIIFKCNFSKLILFTASNIINKNFLTNLKLSNC